MEGAAGGEREKREGRKRVKEVDGGWLRRADFGLHKPPFILSALCLPQHSEMD